MATCPRIAGPRVAGHERPRTAARSGRDSFPGEGVTTPRVGRPVSAQQPDVGDYDRLFASYGADLGSIYRGPDDDRYALLFGQVIRLLIRPSPFNRSLPEPFRAVARRYRDGDPATVAQLGNPANRHFMLCDLHDLVMLKGGLRRRRGERMS